MKALILNVNMVIWCVTPFLLVVGSVIGLRRQPHWTKVISLLGALILVINVAISWTFNRSLAASAEGRSGFLSAATVQMFVTTIGYIVFAVGYVLSSFISKRKE